MTSPLSTGYQVRLRIQDIPRAADITRVGDGTAVRYGFDDTNISSGSAYVPLNNTAWSATGATFNASGWAEVTTILSAQSAIRFTYVHSVFSDDEIGHFTAVGGSVPGAALEAVKALRFDGLKRARWQAADGTQYDDTQAGNNLWRLQSALELELEQDAIGGGGPVSWAEKQGEI